MTFFALDISDEIPSRHRHSNVTASIQQRHGLVVYTHECTVGAFRPGSRTPLEYPSATGGPKRTRAQAGARPFQHAHGGENRRGTRDRGGEAGDHEDSVRESPATILD
jgi:hypothetical protein